jgi:hypothetical protein
MSRRAAHAQKMNTTRQVKDKFSQVNDSLGMNVGAKPVDEIMAPLAPPSSMLALEGGPWSGTKLSQVDDSVSAMSQSRILHSTLNMGG